MTGVIEVLHSLHMYRSLFGAGLVALALAVACGSDAGGVANNNHRFDASGGFAGNTGGSGGTTHGDASAGSGGVSGTGAGGAAGAGNDAGVSFDVCTDPVGNLLDHGTFEEGMAGDAPAFWEVRAPGQPTTCAGSGTPSQHVYLSAAPTGCTGNALTIDALGQWDCYAIQRVSDYNSIQAGATYRISAAVRAQGNSINPAAWFVLGVQWLDANDQFFGDVKNPKTASAADNDFDWKVLSWNVVAPSNATRMLVWLSAHYPGRVDYDNIAVVKL